MEPFLYYLLRASFLIFLIYGFYKFFVSGNTLHATNRLVLLFSVAIIVILPLFHFDLFPEKITNSSQTVEMGNFSSFTVTNVENVATQPLFSWMKVLTVIYFGGLLFFAGRYLIGLCQVISIIRQSERVKREDHAVLCVTDRSVSPFSWVKYIVLCRADYESLDKAILEHEDAHIRFRHSLDMLVFDLFTVAFWFNPFAWCLRHEIISVHEYQADKEVVMQGEDMLQYQILLIRKCVGEYKFAMANNFRQRDLQKRMMMMKKNKSEKTKSWNYALALPVMLLGIVVLAVPVLNAESADHPMNPLTQILNGKEMDANHVNIEDPSLKIRGFEDSLLIIIDGEKQPKDFDLKSIDPKNIESISVLKDKSAAVELYGEGGENGTLIITMKKDGNGKHPTILFHGDSLVIHGSPQYQEEKVVTTINTESGKPHIIIKGYKDSISKGSKLKEQPSNSFEIHGANGGTPLIVVDGEKKSKDFNLSSIEINDIESMTVLKDTVATAQYGKEGENGVILIKTRKK